MSVTCLILYAMLSAVSVGARVGTTDFTLEFMGGHGGLDLVARLRQAKPG